MPSAASITVKKADEATNITYDLLAKSGGDNSPCVWRQDTGAAASLPVGLRAMLRVLTKWNGKRNARQMSLLYRYPYATQDTTTSVYSSRGEVVFSGMVTVPQSIPAADINEAIAQAFNLVAATLLKDTGKSGYAPT